MTGTVPEGMARSRFWGLVAGSLVRLRGAVDLGVLGTARPARSGGGCFLLGGVQVRALQVVARAVRCDTLEDPRWRVCQHHCPWWKAQGMTMPDVGPHASPASQRLTRITSPSLSDYCSCPASPQDGLDVSPTGL